ncbi:DUF3939 domain-containing protein [Bacillus cytotoxicus]|uniref:DUF3939 domain-containing protein n=1 Tax=Bacillus cereus group sp. BfR-BA-01492 TaxID=2920361 RepID=UPI001F58F88B|nr:DUF3939 domain-containing protein [Bacillus cereus group sp. BfR-BA-01492]EMA6343142.1 DUF3939 domain-containing protein [Bacillus cytotoxicus]EMA6345262.1 DUF3939 domain-containing protein [Bacillus cytotoxicus]
MFRFFKSGKEERPITKDELEQAMAKFLETNTNIVYTVLVNDDYTVNYDLLKPYLQAFPTNKFLITKETLEVFEHTDENLELVKEIDLVQKAVDQYVTEKETFPIVEDNEERLICGIKLAPYLDRILKRDLYISEKHYLVSSKPDKKKIV